MSKPLDNTPNNSSEDDPILRDIDAFLEELEEPLLLTPDEQAQSTQRQYLVVFLTLLASQAWFNPSQHWHAQSSVILA